VLFDGEKWRVPSRSQADTLLWLYLGVNYHKIVATKEDYGRRRIPGARSIILFTTKN
jgi:hypothetical protein